MDFKEEHGTVVIEVDCGDVGEMKVERTSYDNKVAIFERTGGGWQQFELGGTTHLVILAHTIVEAFVALNREGIPPLAPAGPFLTEWFRRISMQPLHRGRPVNKPTVDFKEEDRAVVIEIDCGDDVGGVKVERSSDNEVAYLERTGGDWQQVVLRGAPQLVILAHTIIEAFVALNREGIPPPAPAGPFPPWYRSTAPRCDDGESGGAPGGVGPGGSARTGPN